MKKAAISLVLLAWGLTSTTARADIADWIDDHPKIAYSLRWQFTTGGTAYEPPEDTKIAWPDWSSTQQQDLIDAYEDMVTWYHSPDPFHNLNESIAYPPANLCDEPDDAADPRTCVDEAYAWNLYIQWVAMDLMLETEGAVPWSLTEFDTDTLKLLLDSTSIMVRHFNGDGNFDLGTDRPAHPNYSHKDSVLGESLIAPPRYTLAFLSLNNLIGASRRDTIERILEWSKQLAHFNGEDNLGNMEAHWQYRGLPPISRIIEGTTHSETGFEHWTAGCHGTTGLWKNVLRAANIPMEILTICLHSQAHFVTEGLYIDHGDDVYNWDFRNSGLPTGELLIDEMTHLMWFGPNPYNHNDDEFCTPANSKIGHQIDVITGEAESCIDGIDNDGDGDIDCDDSECGPLGVFTQTKITPSDAAAGADFGEAVDVDGNRIIAGAMKDSTAGFEAGAAYIFTYVDNTGWMEEQQLLPSDAANGQAFGNDAAIDDDTAVVGSFVGDVYMGSVYVFERSGSGWTQTAKLVPADAIQGDRFGYSVDIEGDRMLVSAVGYDMSTGAVYVYRRTDGAWTQEARLTASDGEDGDSFGYDVAISGNTMIVGAWSKDDESGAAYIFRYNGSAWIQEAVLTASDLQVGDQFGWSVDLSGDIAIVGSINNDASDTNTGAAYIYRFNGSTWQQEQKLTASDAWANDYFGSGVAIDGNRAVVGAFGEHHSADVKHPAYYAGEYVGAAYVYEFTAGTWSEVKKLTAADDDNHDFFGLEVAVDGSTVVAGAYGNDDAGDETGATYVFDLGETEIGQCASVTPQDPTTGGSPVTLRFEEIVRAGETTVVSSSSGPAVPDGYQLGSPAVYFNIDTSADYLDAVEVCIDYSDIVFASEEELSILHYENNSWTDLCESPEGCSFDPAAEILCAEVDSLSPFVLAEPKNTLFEDISIGPGSASADAVFLSEQFTEIGTQVLMDVFIPVNQPNPYWLGQVQMTANLPSKGIYDADMTTQQLTGLTPGQWHTLSFNVPASVQNALLNSVAGGWFRIIVQTPWNAEPLVFDNFRFGGTISSRDAGPTRGAIDNILSFEVNTAWRAEGASLSMSSTQLTDGAASLKVTRTRTDTVLTGADFLTNELASVGSTLSVDLLTSAPLAWGTLQAHVACPAGQNNYVGQVQLNTLTAGTFHNLSMPMPSNVAALLAAPDRLCTVRFTISAPLGPVLYFDHLEIR